MNSQEKYTIILYKYNGDINVISISGKKLGFQYVLENTGSKCHQLLKSPAFLLLNADTRFMSSCTFKLNLTNLVRLKMTICSQ